MKIEFLYFKDCPYYRPALDRLQRILLACDPSARIEKTEIFSKDGARLHRFLGSPSIRIDGYDIEGLTDPPEFDLNCRIYSDTGNGIPSEDMIFKALNRTD